MMLEIAVVILMLIVIGAVVWLGRPGARVVLPPATADHNTNPYHCVAMRYGAGACEAVKKLTDKRLFSAEAPPLPLPDCDAERCSCRYVHFEDRRHGDRRETYTNGYAPHHGGPEHSSGRDRRQS